MRKYFEPVLRFFRRLVKRLGSARRTGAFRRVCAASAAATERPLRFFMGLWKSWSSVRSAGLLRQFGAYVRKQRELALHFFRNQFSDRESRQKFFERAGSLALMVLITVSSVVTVMASTHVATVNCDGAVRKVEMFSSETDKILLRAGVKAGPDDLVERKDDPEHAGDVLITVRTARKATVAADGEGKTVTAHYGDTVGETLAAADVSLDEDDVVTPPVSAAVLDGTQIQVTRMVNILVAADGRTLSATVRKGSVSDAVRQAGISLGGEDTLSVDPDGTVAEGMTVAVSRVSYKDVTEMREIPFPKVEKKDSSLYAGTKKVATAGKNGSETVVVRQKLVDGKAVESKEVSKTVTAQPVSQVTLVGTKKSAVVKTGSDGTLTDHNGKTIRYKKVLTGKCSTYTGGGWTSTGKKAAFGLVAVNPKIIPYGTRLYIASPNGKIVYGYAVAADTGGAAMRGIIIADLYYDTYAQCMKIGTRTMNVYIL